MGNVSKLGLTVQHIFRFEFVHIIMMVLLLILYLLYFCNVLDSDFMLYILHNNFFAKNWVTVNGF